MLLDFYEEVLWDKTDNGAEIRQEIDNLILEN